MKGRPEKMANLHGSPNLRQEPKKICLPWRVKEESPISFALQRFRKELEEVSMISLSCSQPDYQLYFEIDRSLRYRDDFILIISDVNIEISGGSERAIVYGIQELAKQLSNGGYHFSNVRSVVFQSEIIKRSLGMDLGKLLEFQKTEMRQFLLAMSDARFNKLVLSHEFTSSDKVEKSLRDLRTLANHLAIDLVLSPPLEDTFTVKSPKLVAEVTAGSKNSSTHQIEVQKLDFNSLLQISKRKSPTNLSVEVSAGKFQIFISSTK